MAVAEFVILGYFRLTKTYLHKYKEDIHNIIHATKGTRKPTAEKHRRDRQVWTMAIIICMFH